MDIHWAKEILHWLYPPRCPVCGNVVSEDEGLEMLVCSKCRQGFSPIRPPVCCRCGRSVSEEEEFCQNCRKKHFLYQKGFPIWVYNRPMQRSLAAFKYHGRREYAAYYGQEFVKLYGKKFEELSIQALIPVPLHVKKQKIRGYNQAELFAREIGKRLDICVCKDYLFRVKNTIPQKELDHRQRYQNLQQAFLVNEKKRDCYTGLKIVALVDDIYTTGSTIELCTQVLLRAGIEKVYFAVVSIGS